MRNFFDPWANILGPTGRLLIGRVKFLEPDTSSLLKEIYDVDGRPSENPVYTSTYGLLKHQVLLGDSDYKIQFEAYIGNGNMENDENEANWLLYKTAVSKNGNLSVDDSGISIRTVATMNELKALGGMHDGDVIELIGYYEAGDSGMSRLYIWNAAATSTDDGGSVVSSNTTSVGRWKLVVPGTYVDVRWFGDIPDATARTQSTTTSNVGQRVKAALFANSVHKDLYFSSGFYYFAGANTVSVDKNIILDRFVRFCVKEGTSGTLVKAEEIQGNTDYLFIKEYGADAIGGYDIQADWIDTAWYYSDKSNATGAKFGYTIERALRSVLSFTNTTVKVQHANPGNAVYDGCLIESNEKLYEGTFKNMDIDTSWFVSNWQDSNMHFINCTVKLANCRNADEYIRVKNLIGDYNYGDLGEHTITNAILHGGCLIENCSGTATITGNGSIEVHNASLILSGLTATNSVNAIDSWLTLTANCVVDSIQFRRGALMGAGLTVQVLNDSMFENMTNTIAINCLGTNTSFTRCEIKGYVAGTDVVLHNNDIYSTVEQLDDDGAITIDCIGNMFYAVNSVPARHYVHSTTADTVVSGIWSKNGSAYDTIHWIRLDRTNLKEQDSEHNYSYTGNSEPYLMKWSGRNHPMVFKCYGGHWTRPLQGTGIFATTDVPFCFFNSRDRQISVVPRQRYWKMFTVGKGYLMRTGRIEANRTIGILEGDYNDSRNGMVVPTWTWGCSRTQKPAIFNNEVFGCMTAVSRDGSGEADYIVSFEEEDKVHGEYSYGVLLGYYPSDCWNSNSWTDAWGIYPANTGSIALFVMIDPDFSTNNNPQNFA